MLLLTLRGTPFLYAGEELGLEDAVVRRERVVDPGGRDGCRAPMPWTAEPGHGWDRRAVAAVATRARPRAASRRSGPTMGRSCTCTAGCSPCARRSPALRLGTLELVDDVPDGVLAYERAHGDDRRLVWPSFGAQEPPPRGWEVELAVGGAAILR